MKNKRRGQRSRSLSRFFFALPLFPSCVLLPSQLRFSPFLVTPTPTPSRWRARCCSRRPPVWPPPLRSPRRPARSRGERLVFCTFLPSSSAFLFSSLFIAWHPPSPLAEFVPYQSRSALSNVLHLLQHLKLGERRSEGTARDALTLERARESAFASPFFLLIVAHHLLASFSSNTL